MRDVEHIGVLKSMFKIVCIVSAVAILGACGDEIGEFSSEQQKGGFEELKQKMNTFEALSKELQARANRPCEREEVESKVIEGDFPVPIFPGAIITGTVYRNREHDDKRGETHSWEAGMALKLGEFDKAVEFYQNYIDTLEGWNLDAGPMDTGIEGVRKWFVNGQEGHKAKSNDSLVLSVSMTPEFMIEGCYLPSVFVQYIDVVKY